MRQIALIFTLLIPILTFSQKDAENVVKKEPFKNNKSIFRAYAALGANFTQIDGDRNAGYNNIGANVGFGVFVTFTKKISTSLELSYSMRGARRNLFKPQNTTGGFAFEMDYLEIPLLFNYHDFKIAIFQAGFSFSNIIRSKYSINGSEILVKDDPFFYTWNVDVVAGVTFLIKDRWGINFKFNYSLLNNLKKVVKTLPNGDVEYDDTRGGFIGKQSPSNSLKTGYGSNWFHNVLTFRVLYIIN